MAEKANEQALKYGPLKAKTDSIRVVATSFYNYIESIKEGMLEEFEDKEDFESMSSSSYIDLYFFQKGVISPNGKEFLNQLESFKRQLPLS